jgi:DNA adenine methylase
LIKHLIPFIPEKIEKYYEPFLGGGSMFFFLAPAKAEISDASGALIESYKSVRRDVERTLRFLRPLRPSRTAFNRIKKMEPTNDGQIAGSFIFLNRAWWNGLYRVNSDGVFNVPYGWPRTNFLIDEKIYANAQSNCDDVLSLYASKILKISKIASVATILYFSIHRTLRRIT